MAVATRTRRPLPTASAVPGTRLPGGSSGRRPALAALAVLLILGGALCSGLLVYRSGGRTDVLVASHDLLPGDRVQFDDLRIARVAAEGAGFVLASDRGSFLGTSVVDRVPAGTMITGKMFRLAGSTVPAGAEEIGISLSVGRRPARDLETGNVIRLYRVGNTSSNTSSGSDSGSDTDTGSPTAAQPAAATQVLVPAARVTRVNASSSTVVISVIVPSAEAAPLVEAASAGQVSVSLLPFGTKPAAG